MRRLGPRTPERPALPIFHSEAVLEAVAATSRLRMEIFDMLPRSLRDRMNHGISGFHPLQIAQCFVTEGMDVVRSKMAYQDAVRRSRTNADDD